MKRIAYYCLLPIMAMALFTACEEELEVPKVEKRIISASNVKKVANITDPSDSRGTPMNFKFGIGNALYFSGYTDMEPTFEDLVFDNRTIYKIITSTGERVAVWHPDNADLQVDCAPLQQAHADWRKAVNKYNANEQRLQEIYQIMQEMEDWNSSEYIALEEEKFNLQEENWQLNQDQASLGRRFEDIMDAVSNAAFSNNACSYNGKGYFAPYGNFTIEGKAFLLEFNPDTNRMRVILLDSESQTATGAMIATIFSTTEGLFAVDENHEIHKFSFEQKLWEIQGFTHQYMTSSPLQLFAESDKVYLMECSERKIEIMAGLQLNYTFNVFTLSAPYEDYSIVNEVVPLHDYGYYDSEVSSVYCADPFVVNGKLYAFTGEAGPFNHTGIFCGINLSSNNMSAVFVEGMEDIQLERPLCVMGNKLYALYSTQRSLPDGNYEYIGNLLYEIAF